MSEENQNPAEKKPRKPRRPGNFAVVVQSGGATLQSLVVNQGGLKTQKAAHDWISEFGADGQCHAIIRYIGNPIQAQVKEKRILKNVKGTPSEPSQN